VRASLEGIVERGRHQEWLVNLTFIQSLVTFIIEEDGDGRLQSSESTLYPSPSPVMWRDETWWSARIRRGKNIKNVSCPAVPGKVIGYLGLFFRRKQDKPYTAS
jgi:hypothetical protein